MPPRGFAPAAGDGTIASPERLRRMFKPLPVAIGLRYLRAKRRNGFISFISMASILGIALGVLARRLEAQALRRRPRLSPRPDRSAPLSR